MKTDFKTLFQIADHKPDSFKHRALGWVRARWRDIMIAAEVLHEAQFAAPWRDPQHPHRPNQQLRKVSCC
jgi:hypothetical protein